MILLVENQLADARLVDPYGPQAFAMRLSRRKPCADAPRRRKAALIQFSGDGAQIVAPMARMSRSPAPGRPHTCSLSRL